MNTANFPKNKSRKQAEAVARQASYDKLSTTQKLALLPCGGKSARQVKRLTARLAVEKEEKKAKKVKE